MKISFEQLLQKLRDHQISDFSTDYGDQFPRGDIAKQFEALCEALQQNRSLKRVHLKGAYEGSMEVRDRDGLARYVTCISQIPTLSELTVRSYYYMVTPQFIQALMHCITHHGPDFKELRLESISFAALEAVLIADLLRVAKANSIRVVFSDVTWPEGLSLTEYQTAFTAPIQNPVVTLKFSELAQTVSRRSSSYEVLPFPLQQVRSSISLEATNDIVCIQRAWRTHRKARQSLVPQARFFTALQQRVHPDIRVDQPIPSTPLVPIRPAEKARFLAKFSEPLRTIANDVLEKHFMRVTFNELLVSLRRCINKMNRWLVCNPDLLRVMAGQATTKSQAWMTGLAMHYLIVTPSTVAEIEDRAAFRNFTHGNQRCAILLIDDAAYSGTQLYDNIHNLHCDFDRLTQQVDIFVVLPFCTSTALRLIEEKCRQMEHDPKYAGNLRMHIITDRPLLTLGELPLSDTHKDFLKQKNELRRGVYRMEWKDPDFFSVWRPFGDGTISCFESHDQRFYKVKLLPDVTPPYKVAFFAQVNDVVATTRTKNTYIAINRYQPALTEVSSIDSRSRELIVAYLSRKYHGTPLHAETLAQDDEFMLDIIFPHCIYPPTTQYAIEFFHGGVIEALYCNQTPQMRANLVNYLTQVIIPSFNNLYLQQSAESSATLQKRPAFNN